MKTIANIIVAVIVRIIAFIDDYFYDMDDLMDTEPCYRKDKNHPYRRRWFEHKE